MKCHAQTHSRRIATKKACECRVQPLLQVEPEAYEPTIRCILMAEDGAEFKDAPVGR